MDATFWTISDSYGEPCTAARRSAATAAATAAAESHRAAVVKRAGAAIEAELEAVLRRTKLSLEHQGLPPEVVQGALEDELAHAGRMLKALSGVKVVLDSACAFVLNR